MSKASNRPAPLNLTGHALSPSLAMALDPFGADRTLASRLAGLGGEHPADDPAYVFQTENFRPGRGRLIFTLAFADLTAMYGTLVLRAIATSVFPGTDPIPLRTFTLPLVEVVQRDGSIRIAVQSRKNMYYALAGFIHDDTDVEVAGLSVAVEFFEEPDEADQPSVPRPSRETVEDEPATARVLSLPELASAAAPSLAQPVSQPMTPRQFRERPFARWMAELAQPVEQSEANWADAMVLQALHHYRARLAAGWGLAIGQSPRWLPAYLAGRDSQILVAGTHPHDLPDADPGLALEQLARPVLCPTKLFFQAVDFTVIDIAAIPHGVAGFDYLWSADVVEDDESRAAFPQFTRDCMRCIQPGGLAVHVMHYAGLERDASLAFSRPEIERIALSLVADGHEVAQLKFRGDRGAYSAAEGATPFAIIARRQR